MKVRDLMTRSVECVSPDATLHDAAARMKMLDTGVLPVCENDRIIGMITDRDITVRSSAEGESPDEIVTRDIMTPEVIFCDENSESSEAARMMQDHQIRRLIVVNGDERLVGIVSLGDLAVRSGDQVLSGATVEQISEGPASRR